MNFFKNNLKYSRKITPKLTEVGEIMLALYTTTVSQLYKM